ncbi:DUF1534 domain-containing protein [Pseudomonas caricapapayae]|nr:DUF1534 domain-containing protein [Pseudomonas caricapapayae]
MSWRRRYCRTEPSGAEDRTQSVGTIVTGPSLRTLQCGNALRDAPRHRFMACRRAMVRGIQAAGQAVKTRR